MIISFIRKYRFFLLVLLIGVFLRTYKYEELFLYSHDQDLASWMIKDIVFNGHLRLIGQETSSHGVFIGPLFYYALIPFYFLANWDPIGGIWLSVLIGLLTISSIYFVLSSVFTKRIGLLATFIYSLSFLAIFTDREVVPTTPAILWTVWFFYGLEKILKGKQKYGFIFAAFLFGLVWHINLALLLLAPLVLVAFVLSKKRLDFKAFGLAVVAFVFTLSPFILFEIKHDFQQVNAIVASLTSDSNLAEGTVKGIDKWDRTMQLVYKNTTSLFFGPLLGNYTKLTFWILLGGLCWLSYKKHIKRHWGIIFYSWILLFIIFFSLNSINLSEYYLNGKNIIWVTIFALLIDHLLIYKKYKLFAYGILLTFALVNLYRFFTISPNLSGYVQRRQIIDFIKSDASARGYPCVSVSYITSPGNNFGYRYLFYIENMHVNLPKSGSPVYSIVYPHSMVDKLDKSFGALGLVLPDYQRYNKDSVAVSCSGDNANVSEPMFGYTE